MYQLLYNNGTQRNKPPRGNARVKK